MSEVLLIQVSFLTARSEKKNKAEISEYHRTIQTIDWIMEFSI